MNEQQCGSGGLIPSAAYYAAGSQVHTQPRCARGLRRRREQNADQYCAYEVQSGTRSQINLLHTVVAATKTDVHVPSTCVGQEDDSAAKVPLQRTHPADGTHTHTHSRSSSLSTSPQITQKPFKNQSYISLMKQPPSPKAVDMVDTPYHSRQTKSRTSMTRDPLDLCCTSLSL